MVYFCVEASYPGGIKPGIDRFFRKVLGPESGSGVALVGNHQRDLSWDYQTKWLAEQAASRLRLRIKGSRLDLEKIKVNIYKLDD